MDASAGTADPAERANDLYWGSKRSVNQIADELDLSKGALYAMIQPLATEHACPLCGSQVVFPNRTSKERNRLDCPTCDWDGTSDETSSYDDLEEGGGGLTVPSPPPSITDARMRTIVGGALLGAAAGLALVLWARRR